MGDRALLTVTLLILTFWPTDINIMWQINDIWPSDIWLNDLLSYVSYDDTTLSQVVDLEGKSDPFWIWFFCGQSYKTFYKM